jgi:hypothetical protein
MKIRAISVSAIIFGVVFSLAVCVGVKPAQADFGQNFMRNVDLFLEDFQLHGYLEERLEIQAMDHFETEDFDEAGELRQVRTTVYGDIDRYFRNPFVKHFKFIFRLDTELHNEYLDELDERSSANIYDEYDDFDPREWYLDFALGTNATLRLGRQQISWGRSDFYRGLDIIHGEDKTNIAETESVRHPLVMAKLNYTFTDLNGEVETWVRPGLDHKDHIGDQFDVWGGRYATYGSHGSAASPFVETDVEHEEGDYKDPTYGIRWSGYNFGIDYTLNYLHTFQVWPAINPAMNPYKGDGTKGQFGDFIYPIRDVVGATGTYYLAPPLDTVLRLEASYIMDYAYNYGINEQVPALSGYSGIEEKDLLRVMLSFDHKSDLLQKILSARAPVTTIFQVFDDFIVDYDDDDDLVVSTGNVEEREEHSFKVTGVASWAYANERIKPALAVGYDLTYGGGFCSPSVEFQKGTHWRFKVGYSWYFDNEAEPGSTIGFEVLEENDYGYVTLKYLY